MAAAAAYCRKASSSNRTDTPRPVGRGPVIACKSHAIRMADYTQPLRYTKHMEPISIVIAALAGVALGAALVYFLQRGQQGSVTQAAVEHERASSSGEIARLSAELAAGQTRLAELRNSAE